MRIKSCIREDQKFMKGLAQDFAHATFSSYDNFFV